MTASEIANLESLQAENEKLKQRVADLTAKLYPPPGPMREVKYWIVTGLNSAGMPWAWASQNWADTLNVRNNYMQRDDTHVKILEQTALVPL